MTKKRFTINNDRDFEDIVETYELNCINDNENKTFYFIADSIENVQLFIKRLNELHEENEDRFNEQMYLQKQLHNTQKELEPIRKICKKYRIPIKDLPEILEEYIAYDNDDNW